MKGAPVVYLLLALCLVGANGIKVQDTSKQMLVAGLVATAESTASGSTEPDDVEEAKFEVTSFDDEMGELMVDIFQIENLEDSMYNIIYYKCDKNTDTYEYQVDFDKADLERILNNKALCELQQSLAEGDGEVCEDLIDVTEIQNASLDALISSRESFYDEAFDLIAGIVSSIEEAEMLVQESINLLDSSEVMDAMLQVRSKTSKILEKTATTGNVEKTLALVQILNQSSVFDSVSLEALKEIFSSTKDDYVLMKESMVSQMEKEMENMFAQATIVSKLLSELHSENDAIIETADTAEDCVRTNDLDESVLTDTIKMEEQRLHDFEDLCKVLYEKYSYLSSELYSSTSWLLSRLGWVLRKTGRHRLRP